MKVVFLPFQMLCGTCGQQMLAANLDSLRWTIDVKCSNPKCIDSTIEHQLTFEVRDAEPIKRIALQ